MSNNLDEKYLLYTYLIKQAKKEHGISESEAEEYAEFLMQNKSKNLFGYHGLAWELGSKNLEFFCMYFLSNIYAADGCAEIAPIHSQMWEELTDMILYKSHDKQAYLLPRGTGKSSFVSLALSIWCSVYKYKRYTIIASAIGDTASTFIRNIRLAIDGNERIEKGFGKIYNPKKFIDNTEQIELANKSMIQSISASSTLRGKSYGNIRIELLLLDDYQKDDEVRTDEQREKKWKKFSDDVNYAMQKDNATMIACGTIQNRECFYSRIFKSNTWKSRKEKGVLIENVDELFNSGLWEQFRAILFDRSNEHRLDYAKEFYLQNEEAMQYPLLWQSYWSCLDLALAYYENPASFKQEVQGDVESIGIKRFTTIIDEKPEDIESHTFEKTMLAIDPAGITNKNKKRSDYFAFAVGSLSDNDVKYIRKGEVLKFKDFNGYLNHVLDLLKKYQDITHCYIEKQTYMGLDVQRLQELIEEDPQLRLRDIEFINEAQYKNKDDKINTIVPDVNMGRIIFNRDDVEFIQQFKDYAGVEYSIHDDSCDITSELAARIMNIEVIRYVKVHDRRKFGL